jgi:hypothetical protein
MRLSGVLFVARRSAIPERPAFVEPTSSPEHGDERGAFPPAHSSGVGWSPCAPTMNFVTIAAIVEKQDTITVANNRKSHKTTRISTWYKLPTV